MPETEEFDRLERQDSATQPHQRHEQDSPGQQPSYAAQEIQAHLHPAPSVCQNLQELRFSDSWTHQDQQFDQRGSGQRGYSPESDFEAYARNPDEHVDEVLRDIRGQDAPLLQVYPMQQGHSSQQGQPLEQDGFEQKGSYMAQDIPAHLYPALEMGGNLFEQAEPNHFAQQDDQLEQGLRQQQHPLFGPGNEAHPENDYPSGHVTGGLRWVSIGQESALLRQEYLNWQEQQSAQYWVEQPSSRHGPWNSESPSQGLRMYQNMYDAAAPDQVWLGNHPVRQLWQTGPPWSERQELGGWLRSQGHPAPGTQWCRGMHGIGTVTGITPPPQITPRMQAERVPMPHVQSAQHSQQSGPKLPAQQGSRVPERRKKSEKWECPTC